MSLSATTGPDELRRLAPCVRNLSKDLRGDMALLEDRRHQCRASGCTTLTTTQVLWVDVAPLACDSAGSFGFDGRLVVERLVTVLETDTGHRGVHTGDFRWTDGGVVVDGSLHGITNVGGGPAPGDAAERPPFGLLMGRLSGRVERCPREPAAVGALVTGVYRLHVKQTGDRQGPVAGVLEGALLIPCD